jgi:hypothetical protein
MKKTIALVLFCSILWCCEKDDICEEGAAITPQLIITFYDNTNPTEKKDVENFIVYGVNDNNEAVLLTTTSITTTDSIAAPLRTDSDITKLVFHKNIENSDFETGNYDIVQMSYSRQDVYISRACGYVQNFTELNTSLETDLDNWISSTEIINTSIENETSAHVKIYH